MVHCKRVPLSTLRPGAVLMSQISDPVNPRTRLLTQGTQITETFIQQLQRRGIDSVILSVRDIAILNAFSPAGRRTQVPPAHHYVQSNDANDYSEEIDGQVEDREGLDLGPIDQPVAQQIQTPVDCSYADGLPLQWATAAEDCVETINAFFDDTIDNGNSDVQPLRQTCQQLLDRIAEDRDALVCLACTPFESDYPSRHGIHTTGVALSVGVEMGLDHDHLMDLGIGCLIHDIGMRAVGVRMFDTNHTLTDGQLKRLADHPVKAVEIAGRYGDAISESSRMVAYQLHERGDGSGYPRGITADQIHPLAKIASVADAFVGMLTRRKHRLAIQGYYVMAKLLEELKAGKFDVHVVRALLNVASLYPIGSYVKLDNDCIGRVIRTGHQEFVRPTLELWHPDYLDHDPVVVNLVHEPETRIVGAIPAPKAA